jgi:hypothetical protein
VSRTARIALFLALVGVYSASAQAPAIRGYYLNVGLWSDSTPFNPGGFADVNRLRLMSQPAIGPVDIEVAYEHVLTYTARMAGGASGGIVVPGGGEWVELQWDLEESDHVVWRHRFDRLNASWAPKEWAALTVGRQTISWGTTLLLGPADPFIPFDPSDPFRDYRAGVDALRVQLFPSPLSDFDLVLRPAKVRSGDTVVDETLTLLGRGRGVWQGWELSGWLGVLHDRAAAAVGAAGGVGQLALRGELSLRDEDDDLAVRGAVGVDSRLDLFGRDFYWSVEYQHDDLGATGAGDLIRVASSDAFGRGELQTLARDIAATQLSYQLHPLWSSDLLVLWSFTDQSALVSPGVSYSASNEITLRAGLFVGLGDDTPSGANELPSEYGITPTLAYLSASLFF